MKYVDVVNKYRSDNFPDMYKPITCWSPFQAMHINKKGDVRSCPFQMKKGSDRYFTREDGTTYRGENIAIETWSPEKSLLDIWNGKPFEAMRLESMEGSLHDFCLYCINQCKEDKPPSSLDFDWVGGERSISHEYPREIELELSNSCNYHCAFCSPFHSSQHMEAMGLQDDPRFKSVFDDTEIKEAFIEDLRSIIHNIYRLNFTGGEPFAQRVVYDILKMIDEEQPENLGVHFTTNGSIMNGAVRKIAQRNNVRFTVSLDSLDPETYPQLRINGNLKNVLNNIETLRQTQAYIGCSFVISKMNVRELPNIISWCNEKQIEFSYHLIVPMMNEKKFRDIVYPQSVELQSKEYIQELKSYLGNAEIYMNKKNDYLSNKNLTMFKQYIERLK